MGKGTGLGLSMVYGFVEQHEGAIHVYSEPNLGTTFKIYLPVVAGHRRGARGRATPAAVGGGETILVAEDDPMVRDVARRILQKPGFTVLLAADGEGALGVLQARRHESTWSFWTGSCRKWAATRSFGASSLLARAEVRFLQRLRS